MRGSVLTTVLDREGGLVPALQKQDFTLLDNGKPQEIVQFHQDVRPLTFVVLVDFSFSMGNNLALMRTATAQLIRSMRSEDVGQLGAFSDHVADVTLALEHVLILVGEGAQLDALGGENLRHLNASTSVVQIAFSTKSFRIEELWDCGCDFFHRCFQITLLNLALHCQPHC